MFVDKEWETKTANRASFLVSIVYEASPCI